MFADQHRYTAVTYRRRTQTPPMDRTAASHGHLRPPAGASQSNKCGSTDRPDRYISSAPHPLVVASHKMYCTMLTLLLTQSVFQHAAAAAADAFHLTNHTTSDHSRSASGPARGPAVILIRNTNRDHHQQQQSQQPNLPLPTTANGHHNDHYHISHKHGRPNRHRRQHRRSSNIDPKRRNDSEPVISNITDRLPRPAGHVILIEDNHTLGHSDHSSRPQHRDKSQAAAPNDYLVNNTADYNGGQLVASGPQRNPSEEEKTFADYFSQFTGAAYCLIFLVGLCGNVAVITVILLFTRNENVTDIYILNLASADLAYIIGLLFMIITVYKQKFIFGNFICKIYMSMTSLNQFASIFLLVVMSFDRYIAVCHPIYAQHFRNPHRAKVICAAIWIISLTLMQPIFLYSKLGDKFDSNRSERASDSNATQIEHKDTCQLYWPDEGSLLDYAKIFTWYSFLISFAIPLSLIACFYVRVIRKLRTSAAEQMTKNRSSRRTRARESTNKRIEHLVIAIILTYTVCWLPYWIVQMYMSDIEDGGSFPEAYMPIIWTATILSYTNSALNPILYAFLSGNFQRRFSEILGSNAEYLGSILRLFRCIGADVDN